jgi:membrane protein YdbS with pleckstrin-like domain
LPGTLVGVPIARRALADDEEVLVDLRLHWIFFFGPAVLTAAAVAGAIAVAVTFPKAPVAVAGVLAVMVAIPALWLAGRLVRWLGISLVVTTTRLIYRQGVMGRDVVQLRLQRVGDIQCTQTLVDRVIGSGRLVVELVGEEPMVIDDVRRPRALQRVITRQLDTLTSGRAPTGPSDGVYPVSDVPAYPISVPRPVSFEDTPPHGFMTSPRPVPPTQPGLPGWPLPSPGVAGATIPEQLIELDDLRQRGIISDEEFRAKKAELLSRY